MGLTLALRDLIRSEKPDLVQTTLFFSTVAGRVAARVGPPIVTTLANQDYGPEHRAHSRYGACGVRAAQL